MVHKPNDDRLFGDNAETPETGVPHLFTPFRIRDVTARNRIVVSPMCQYRSVDGAPTDWHLVYLGKFAQGGAGIVFYEDTAIEARGRKTYDCAGLYSDVHVAGMRRITDFIREMGAVPAIQLGHSGNQASTHGPLRNWEPLTAADTAAGLSPWTAIGPTNRPANKRFPPPAAMDESDINKVILAWEEAAKRSVDAGFSICEVHGAHGYLIHQFLSPSSNTRNDGYGGDRNGRMRFALEIIDRVRRALPSGFPLFFRVSSVDGKGGEWGLEDSVELAKVLKEHEVDVIDCSSGGITGDSELPAVPRVPGYQIGYSSRIRAETGMPTMGVGMITDPGHAETLVREGHADLVAIGRELMLDPNWPVHAGQALGYSEALDLLPSSDGHRLKMRVSHYRNYPSGSVVQIPTGVGESLEYSWDRLRPLLPSRGEDKHVN